MDWEDFDDVAHALVEKYSDTDPLSLSFPKLHQMILDLKGFTGSPSASDEAKLETIQMAWYDEVRES